MCRCPRQSYQEASPNHDVAVDGIRNKAVRAQVIAWREVALQKPESLATLNMAATCFAKLERWLSADTEAESDA